MSKLILSLLFCLIASSAEATTYWYSTSGGAATCADADGDADPGQYRTLAQVVSCLSAGDVAMGKAGTYTSVAMTLTIPSGTVANPTTITCETIRACVFEGVSGSSSAILQISSARSHITISKLKLDSSLRATGTGTAALNINGTIDNIIFEDNEMIATTSPSRRVGVYLSGGVTNSTMRRNKIHTGGSHGFYIQGDSNIVEHNYIGNLVSLTGNNALCTQFYSENVDKPNNNIFRYNVCNTGNGSIPTDSDGLYLASSSGNIAHNNIIMYAAIGLTMRGSSNKFYNNNIYSVTTGMNVSAGTGCEIKNNALPGESMGTADADCTYSKNIATNGDISTSVTPAQLWVDPANLLFSLIESSAGIDTGTAVSEVNYVGAGPDVGAFEAPIRSSAVVEDTDKNTYLITFSLATQSTRNGTGLQGCTTANWTLRDDGAGKTESACNVVTSSKIGVDVSDGDFTAGVIDDAYARGTLTDNICIGDCNGTVNVNFFNAYVRTYSATAGTNNVGAPVSTALTQSRFRFHKLRGTEASPSLICTACSENVSTSTPPGAAFRLRVKFRTDDDPAGTTYKLRYSKDAGAYTDIPDTMGADYISWYGVTADSDIPAAGAATTELLTSDEAANVACAVVRSSSDYPVLDLGNSETECEYVIKISTSAAASTTYDFRVYKSDNTALDTYSVTPRLTIGNYVMGF